MNKKYTEHDTKPNILLICSDQHSRRISGCYEDSIVDTPAMDRLAKEGTLFKSAYCNAPLCVPSRMSFLTGLYPFKNECLNNGMCLDSRIPTFAHMALTEGYHTVLSGRMHFMGQDQYHGFVERLVGDVGGYDLGTGILPFTPLVGDLANGSLPDPFNVVGAGETYCLDYDRDVTATTCDWLNRHADDEHFPFLMMVGFFNPHCPFIVSPELYEKYKGKVSLQKISAKELDEQHALHQQFREKSSDGVADELKLKARTAYYGQVDFLDQQINKILETLDSAGLAKNTIVVYFSDHGEMLGAHGRWHKMCFFEDSIGVPLLIRMPDQAGAGEVVSANVSLVDLFPTICDWVLGKK